MDIRTSTLEKIMLAALALQVPGLAAPGNLSVSDTLNSYQLYGKNWVVIVGDAETSQDGGIGSDKHVDITNNNVKINGSLSSGDKITAKQNVDVAGFLNARGNVTLTDDGNSVMGKTNVGGTLTLSGGNPTANTFGGTMNIGVSPIGTAGWAINSYNGTNVTGPVNPGNAPPGVTFGTNTPFPSNNVRFPDTTVNFDATKNCSTVPGVTFNMSMCGFGGSATDTVLPPGRYGDFLIASMNNLYMTSGTYHFKSFEMMSDQIKVLFIQPGSGTTKMLIQNFLRIKPGKQLIAPTKYTDPSFKSGTVFIYVEGIIHLDDDNEIWATVVGKNHVQIESGLHLYGQVFGDCLTIENGFKGGVGFGKYIPIGKGKGPLKYSVIHFKHAD